MLGLHSVDQPSFVTLGNTALISIRSTSVMSLSVHGASALSTLMAAAVMADRPFLLPICPSLSSPLRSASSDSSSATTCNGGT